MVSEVQDTDEFTTAIITVTICPGIFGPQCMDGPILILFLYIDTPFFLL